MPEALRGRPFTRREALAAGVPPDSLRSRRFVRMFRDVYRCADAAPSFAMWIVAALLVLPTDVVISHVTALRWYGVEVASVWPLHFSTNSELKSRHVGIMLHRRRGKLRPFVHRRRAVSGPERAFVESATMLSFVKLVTAGDWLLRAERTTLAALCEYAESSHLHGVVRARLALRYVCEKVESPMETVIRLMLIFARLPQPDCNPDIMRNGRFVARCDMVYHAYKVVVEYDGEWHERKPEQRRRDIARREDLEALGWTIIVVVVEDLKHKQNIVHRVHRALVANGYEGREPIFNAMWTKWFA